ncbi:hypothetical protein [Eggerthella timonensis]|uniref:hypothetical protein n=1 Tax=Eggerthella timonensis TaxID=1871008 RepID=UPI000C784183|nr:hypothetical protein [Eggerthella timonensis]
MSCKELTVKIDGSEIKDAVAAAIREYKAEQRRAFSRVGDTLIDLDTGRKYVVTSVDGYKTYVGDLRMSVSSEPVSLTVRPI